VDPTSDFTFFFFFFFRQNCGTFFSFFISPWQMFFKGHNKSIFGYCGVEALSCNAFILRHTLHLFDTNRVNHLPGPIFLKPIYSNEAHIKGYVNEKKCIYIYIYIYTLFITLGILCQNYHFSTKAGYALGIWVKTISLSI
jgi:hypothetical protein